MKKTLIFFYILLYLNNAAFTQNVGIGTNTPNPSAALDISSTTKGLLPPRISVNDIGNIVSPAAGLIVYVFDRQSYYFYNGVTWKQMIIKEDLSWNKNGTAIYNDNIPGNIGIGTATPNSNAVLDITSANKGILFPRMTTTQRNAIVNPPDGLHIYNSERHTLEAYDSEIQMWVNLCDACGTYSDTIKVNRETTYSFPDASYKRYLLVINTGINVIGSLVDSVANPAIDLSNLPNNSIVIIKNLGGVYGRGGNGGRGYSPNNLEVIGSCSPLPLPPENGANGAHAISLASYSGISLTVQNYGIIAGGGGGGGGNYTGTNGGGGGAGNGIGGKSGSSYQQFLGICSVIIHPADGNGSNGLLLTGGTPGINYSGSIGNAGAGGSAGQPGRSSWGGAGGKAGKAVGGNAGRNTVINIGAGIVYGVVD